jgi:hypothetical protein
VGTQLTLALFIKQEGLTVLPLNNEVLRFNVVNQARSRLDPLDFPPLTPDVLKHSNTLKGCVAGSGFPDPILFADLDF